MSVPKKLEPYPFHDGGVNENAAIRMVRMVIPQCPIETDMESPRYTGEDNCQRTLKFNSQGRWNVEACEEKGHDPYRTTIEKKVKEDIIDENGVITGQRQVIKGGKRLNIIQVSDNIRHSSGMEIQLALARGCKFLEDFGIASPCEFRNCSQPQRVDTKYGRYCSERHARLIAADKRKMMLPVGGDPFSHDEAMEQREQMLDSINIERRD